MAKPKPKSKAAFAKKKLLAAQIKQKTKKPNPFELKGSKSHFEALGRRTGGAKKNVVKAREEAVVRRKKTLLVEYKQLRKANTFIDRRFGEHDPEMSEGDKGLARMRVQRVKQHRKGAAKFVLGEADGADGDDMQLTHLGKSLADVDGFKDRPGLEDLDQDLVEELVQQYHFGGGGEEDGDGTGTGPDGKRKTHKQIMEEVIAKSHMYRELKAKQREEDEAAGEQLNQEFKELTKNMSIAALLKPVGWTKSQPKVKPDNALDAAYDVAARELAFEAKGAAGDRTLSPEELLERERQRLEKLEAARLKRMMRGGDDDGSDDGEDDEEEEEADGRKRRRAVPSGDALGDDYNSASDDDDDGDGEEGDDAADDDGDGMAGVSELDRRRMQAAAGDHPLQESLRAAAAQLAKKYGVQAPKNPFLEEDDDEDDEEEGDDEGEEEEGESEGSQGEGDDEDEVDASDDEGEDEGEEEEGEEEGEGGSDEEAERAQLEERRNPQEPPSSSGKQQDALPHPGKQAKQPAGFKGRAPALDGPLDLPYTIPLPASYQAFASLVQGRPAADVAAAIQRIRAFNATALAADSKRKLQEFYGILVQHFALLAGQRPIPVASLDVLHKVLLELTPEVPYYAATVARARLARMSDQLTQALAAMGGATAREATAGQLIGAPAGASVAATEPVGARKGARAAQQSEQTQQQQQQQQGGSPWPTARVLLQLKLFASLFPVSDRRHPVLSPMALIIGKYLNQCPVSTPHEAAAGVFLCSLAQHMAAPARRHMPEVPAYLTDCINAFLPHVPASGGAAAHAPVTQREDAFVRFAPGLMALAAAAATARNGGSKAGQHGSKGSKDDGQVQHLEVPELQLYDTLAAGPTDPRFSSDTFKLALLRCALHAVRRAADLAAGYACFEQLFAPLRASLASLKRALPRLPPALEELRSRVAQELATASEACVSRRVPMVQAGRAGVAGRVSAAAAAKLTREFNPRFEEDFAASRDYDPDRQRAQTKRLKRQLVKERRGAMRELRRDAVFMAGERDLERSRVDVERMESQKKFYAELQRQEADMKSGGQGGMNPHLKKKAKK